MRKNVLFHNSIKLICILMCSNTGLLASTIRCPTVLELKNNKFNQWLPLYREGEELASDDDVEQFKKQLTSFVEAKWDRDYLESAHCFYSGTHPIHAKIVIAQDAWRPEETPQWSWVTFQKVAICSQSEEQCRFIS